MHWFDWLIILIPLAFVIYIAWYSRRYIVGVSDYLVAGRVCYRYVLSTADMACALGLVTLAAFVEIKYKTGFALTFWNTLLVPLTIMVSLTGYVYYRFRETRAMSIGQFLEMRYSRGLRVFASFLRSIAEMMANMIMPALAAGFFITFFDLPRSFEIFGVRISVFFLIMLVTLTLAISIIYMGGILSIIVANTIQGLICLPVILIFMLFVFWKFDWSRQIITTMMNRVPGESFINPFDIEKLRDFNLFMLFLTFLNIFFTAGAGITGSNNAAKNAQEAKMASILGTWRNSFQTVFYTSIAVAVITILNCPDFIADSRNIRVDISQKISEQLIDSPTERAEFMARIEALPEEKLAAAMKVPASEDSNPDTLYFDTAQEFFGRDGEGASKTQQYKTLFRQLMFPATMRNLLPPVLMGLFGLLIVLFILSTDNGRIFSASSTLVQDCVVPFCKNEDLTPERHIFYIRAISIGVGVFFLIGSLFMAQLDYINLFIGIMYGLWTGGCGPMIIFGFYSRFGTTAGAWASLLSGMLINLSGALLQRNWADVIYPYLERSGLVEPVGNFLSTVSGPFNPYVVWKMNHLKFPINSYEISFIAILTSLVVYIVVSYLTCREPFNLERMLHRGKYATEGEKKIHSAWTWKSVWEKLIGITPEYSTGDKIIAWTIFFYSFIYGVLVVFVGVLIWNLFSPWPAEWWGTYFMIVTLLVPGIAAGITAVWFTIGSVVDIRRLFRDLKGRKVNTLDNGMVEGHMSLDDKQVLEAVDRKPEK